jgi:hypothetical protein
LEKDREKEKERERGGGLDTRHESYCTQ